MVYSPATPINQNLLPSAQFNFSINRLPNTTYFGQGINIPGMSLPEVPVGTPFTKIKVPGDSIDWDPLKVEFKVDEDFRNWQELYNWMVGLGFPKNFDQYKDLKEDGTVSINPKGSVYSDGNITILDSSNNPNIRIGFQNLFITGLSGLQFETTQTGIDYINAEATFGYTLFEIERL